MMAIAEKKGKKKQPKNQNKTSLKDKHLLKIYQGIN